MIKAFIFDYGGVVSQGGGLYDLTRRLAKALNIPLEEAYDLQKLAWGDLLKGKIDNDQFWDIVAKHYPKQIPASERDIWNGWAEMMPDQTMLKLIKDLKAKNYPVGLLSNILRYTADQIKDNGGYDLFDFTILSCDYGIIKPDKKIYQLAINQLDKSIDPSDIVYLDDQERYLTPARELGLKTILVSDFKQAASEVEKLIRG